MTDQEPYCDFRTTVRVEIQNRPGGFAELATAIAQEGATRPVWPGHPEGRRRLCQNCPGVC
jgi:hypothetical protein